MSENESIEGQSQPDLSSQITLIKDRVRGVVHGLSNGMYLHGRPGTSKTYSVRETLDTLDASYYYHNGHLTPVGLFDVLADNAERIIVLDDVSSIFGQSIALQLLLAALGASHDGTRIREVPYTTAREKRTVRFSGGIVLISNLRLTSHHKEVIAALRDRVNVVNYEPTDEQIVSLIFQIAKRGVGDATPAECAMVAQFTINQCRRNGVRPSTRLFKDKAIVDFQLWKMGKTELHWQALTLATIKQAFEAEIGETRDLTRAEKIAAEQRIAIELYLELKDTTQRLEKWKQKTHKSTAAFYRRLADARENGLLELPVNEVADAPMPECLPTESTLSCQASTSEFVS